MYDIDKINEVIKMVSADDRQLFTDLIQFRDTAVQTNAQNDFELLIGGIYIPNVNEAHKKLRGYDIINRFTWNNIDDVPKNLAVFDKEGDLWKFVLGEWRFRATHSGLNSGTAWISPDSNDRTSYGPWTVFYNFKD